LVGDTDTKEAKKCFRITYTSGEVEVILATSLGVTEDLGGFVTFYIENRIFEEELVCLVNQSTIRKIETIVAPKVTFIVNGEKRYE
jgi:uncharacterized membrane protein